MNTKLLAYSRQELQEFSSYVHEQIRSNGLPQSYASGLPFHEAKRNYIKERINNWVSSKNLAFEHAKRREAQLQKEQERIRQKSFEKSEKEKEQAIIEAEQKRLDEIKCQEFLFQKELQINDQSFF